MRAIVTQLDLHFDKIRDVSNALTELQAKQFETPEEMKLETDQIREAQRSDTVKTLATEDAEKLKSDGDYQERAKQELEEAAISQDTEITDAYE